MDHIEFHREPPTDVPTMVTAFSGWIDAGEAATDAMRFLVRQLAAEPLATMDLEDFVDFTQDRPAVRLNADGERTIRWPRSAFWLWQPPEPHAGLLLFRGLEPQRRWRTYATALLDVAARCGVQQIVSLGTMLADLPHTRPPRVTGSSTDPHWHARLEAWGMARRSRYEGPTGIASVLLDAARRRGIASLTLMGQAPHYLQGTTNPRGGAPRRHTMERQTVQQVVDYLKTHPDIAKKALDFFKAHPDDVKGALSQVAKERGWDLSNIDTNALKAEIGKLS